MASSDPRKELICSICLNLYTDPVSLRCGHNFCRSCIVQALDTQDGSGGYFCPDCKAEYPERPPLEKRRKLDDTEEHFISTQPDMEETRIFCIYCTKSPVPAVKSCLQCEISLCDDHLTAHNKTVDHIVTEPTGFFDGKKCSMHKKVLEYYCLQDAACLCVSCCLVGKHRGHQVILLDEAFEKKKKKLRKNLEKLIFQKAEIQTRFQNLHGLEKDIQEKASIKREYVSKIFMDIKEQLEMAEKKALSEISRQEEKIMSQIPDLIRKLEIEEDKLSKKICHLEEMCHVTDPIRLLQKSNIRNCGRGDGEDTGGDGEKIKSQDDSDVHVSDKKVHDNKTDPVSLLQESGKAAASRDKSMVAEEAPVGDLPKMADDVDKTSEDLDEVLISLTIHRSMRDIVTNLTSQLGFHVPDILLDEDTAHEFVRLSKDLKTAREVFMKQERKPPPGRFLDYPQVLSRCGLSSGRHYWEVEWNGLCKIGMSYPSIEKKGDESYMGDNDISWILDLEISSVSHDMYNTQLDLEETFSKCGVFLDYEAGRLSFYEMCDPIRHLHTFTASFTEPLHAIFYVDDYSIITVTT